VHLIELQESKRQALRKRITAKEEEESEDGAGINWDDLDSGNEDQREDIPESVQDKLLSDYERELIAQKLKKGGQGNLEEEMSKVKLLSEAANETQRGASPEEKGE